MSQKGGKHALPQTLRQTPHPRDQSPPPDQAASHRLSLLTMNCPKLQAWPCGQCLVCRINKSRTWTARLMLESQMHPHSLFETFTYAKTHESGSLRKAHLVSTINRLRSSCNHRGIKFRYYGIGEYGDQTSRPHYHLALFGLDPSHTEIIERAWAGLQDSEGYQPGHVDHGTLEPQSAAYITGYLTKKLSREEYDWAGLEPQFALMSLKPGLGLPWLPHLFEALTTRDGASYLRTHQDVPTAFSIGGRSLPLGPYLRQRLRALLFGDHRQPEPASRALGLKEHIEILKELPPLPINSTAAEELAAWSQAQSTHKERKQISRKQRALQVKKRHEIFSQMRQL